MTRLIGTSLNDIREAARLVHEGGLIAYPTDTVYGLGCNPFDANAVDRLVKAKERVKGSLPILVSSLAEAERIGEINEVAAALATSLISPILSASARELTRIGSEPFTRSFALTSRSTALASNGLQPNP